MDKHGLAGFKTDEGLIFFFKRSSASGSSANSMTITRCAPSGMQPIPTHEAQETVPAAQGLTGVPEGILPSSQTESLPSLDILLHAAVVVQYEPRPATMATPRLMDWMAFYTYLCTYKYI